ncbi:hypothetical protein [Streptomyces europaeiscabiei]|uniref:hypothetical protein n=1 Tax=Streptomyces europaeiscabiei TaxID=146819 RepID=UPI0038F6B580
MSDVVRLADQARVHGRSYAVPDELQPSVVDGDGFRARFLVAQGHAPGLQHGIVHVRSAYLVIECG